MRVVSYFSGIIKSLQILYPNINVQAQNFFIVLN
jgi:hypothetical protein